MGRNLGSSQIRIDFTKSKISIVEEIDTLLTTWKDSAKVF